MRLTLCFVILITATILAEEPTLSKNLSSNNGRYVFGQISSTRKDQFMLDTQTGRLWQVVIAADSSFVLQEILYIDLASNRFSGPCDQATTKKQLDLIKEDNKRQESYKARIDSLHY